MIMIKKLKMWKDPGYTEECVECPPIGSRLLPVPDWENVTTDPETQEDVRYELRPRKGSTLSALELPLSFSEVWDMSYLWMTAKDDAGSFEVFGWIRGVEQIAGANEAVRIVWVPDYWRTFSADLTFGRGVITKTDNATYKRPLSMHPRLIEYISSTELKSDNDLSTNQHISTAVIFTYTKTNSSGKTETRFGITSPEIKGNDVNTYHQGLYPSWIDSISYYFGIPSASILGAWIVPFPAYINAKFKGNDKLEIPVADSYLESYSPPDLSPASPRYWYEAADFTPNYECVNVNAETTDTEIYRLIDSYGTPYLTLPYGKEIKSVIVTVDVGATECYMSMMLCKHDKTYIDSLDSTPLISRRRYFQDNRAKAINEGCFVNIPAVPLAVSSAALSDYYLTGQREFDIETRRIEQEKALAQGISGAAGSMIGGALTGALLGGGANPVTAAAGAIVGGVVSIGGSMWSNEITTKANDKLQKATDKLYANQTNSLITIGSTYCTYNITKRPAVAKLEADSISKAELIAFVTNQGYDVEIPAANVSGFMTTGPFACRNLNVVGDAPPVAKSTIKAKLEAGVFFVENNTTGADPAL